MDGRFLPGALGSCAGWIPVFGGTYTHTREHTKSAGQTAPSSWSMSRKDFSCEGVQLSRSSNTDPTVGLIDRLFRKMRKTETAPVTRQGLFVRVLPLFLTVVG